MTEVGILLVMFGVGVLAGILMTMRVDGDSKIEIDDDVCVVGKDGEVKAVSLGDEQSPESSAVGNAYYEYLKNEGVEKNE